MPEEKILPPAPGFLDQLVFKQTCTIERLVEVINDQQRTIETLKLPNMVGSTPPSSRATLDLAEQVTKWMDKEEGIWKEAFSRDEQLHKRLQDVERACRMLMDAANQGQNGSLGQITQPQSAVKQG
jgi:hypothetical protein